MAGVSVLTILGGVALFLVIKSGPAIGASASELPGGKTLIDYVAPLVFGTILAATVAVVIAVPLAVAVALFISHIAPRRIANTLAYIVDLLAAIPSIVYGLWGIFVLGPAIVPVLDWLVGNLDFIPIFKGPASVTGRTMLTAGARAGRDDPADRLGGLARGLLANPPKAGGGRPRPRRHALGDDPDGRVCPSASPP